MIVIPLNSPKHGTKYAFIDCEDFEKIKNHNWHVAKQNQGFVATSDVRTNKKQRTITMHRIITDCPKGMVVDHINHNPLDNRKENLRICTSAENTRNRKIKEGCTSKYKGVIYREKRKKYVATIVFNRKTYNLGYYKNEIDAAIAYNEAAIKYHGEFAYINKIDRI